MLAEPKDMATNNQVNRQASRLLLNPVVGAPSA